MNSKITFHLLTFLKFVGNLNYQFDARMHPIDLTSILEFQSRKVFYYKLLIRYCIAYSLNITSILFKHDRPTGTIHPSNFTTSFKYEYCCV